jgi:PhzF family phenazine biosynthesis protein
LCGRSTNRKVAVVTEILRYAAFTESPEGGNPAGVVLEAGDLDPAAMQAIAAEVNYSETAFLLPGSDLRDRPVRYYSPLAEVPFCGHATIATAVAHAERHGPGGSCCTRAPDASWWTPFRRTA